jgi:hypothetical protein
MMNHDEPRDYNVSSKVSLQQEGRDEVTLHEEEEDVEEILASGVFNAQHQSKASFTHGSFQEYRTVHGIYGMPRPTELNHVSEQQDSHVSSDRHHQDHWNWGWFTWFAVRGGLGHGGGDEVSHSWLQYVQ